MEKLIHITTSEILALKTQDKICLYNLYKNAYNRINKLCRESLNIAISKDKMQSIIITEANKLLDQNEIITAHALLLQIKKLANERDEALDCVDIMKRDLNSLINVMQIIKDNI